MTSPHHDRLLESISGRTARVGVIGLGYVGLPLAVAVARSGFHVTGFDIDPGKIVALDAGSSYIEAVSDEALAREAGAGRFRSTTDFSDLGFCDVIIICVPTPLTRHRDPDLSFVENTSRAIADCLRPGQLVVLESTTYPGTTDGIVRSILEETGSNPAPTSSSDSRRNAKTRAIAPTRPRAFPRSWPETAQWPQG